MSVQSEITRISSEVSNQASLISQIASALEGKTVGGGNAGGGNANASIVAGDFTYIEQPGDEPGAYDYVLTASTLQSSTRKLIVIFSKNINGYKTAYKVLYRANLADDFTIHNGSNSDISHGMNCIVNDNQIIIVSLMITGGSTFGGFAFLAV